MRRVGGLGRPSAPKPMTEVLVNWLDGGTKTTRESCRADKTAWGIPS
jgi:hypothetical protein